MAWGMDLSGLPRLKSYADCSAWRKARSKELARRNIFWNSSRVPLAGFHKQHIFMELKGDNSFALTLYTTPLVVYHQDGFVSVSTYNTPASRDFMNAVLPDGIRAILRNGTMHLEVDCADGVRYCEPRYNEIKLEPIPAHGRWHIPYGRTRPRRIAQVDWRKFHGIKQRKAVKSLLLWRQTAQRLGLEPKLKRQTPTMQKVLEAIDDQSLWADTFGDFPPNEILCMVAEAEGILKIDMNASTAMPYGRPVTSELKGKMPWLISTDEVVSL